MGRLRKAGLHGGVETGREDWPQSSGEWGEDVENCTTKSTEGTKGPGWLGGAGDLNRRVAEVGESRNPEPLNP